MYGRSTQTIHGGDTCPKSSQPISRV